MSTSEQKGLVADAHYAMGGSWRRNTTLNRHTATNDIPNQGLRWQTQNIIHIQTHVLQRPGGFRGSQPFTANQGLPESEGNMSNSKNFNFFKHSLVSQISSAFKLLPTDILGTLATRSPHSSLQFIKTQVLRWNLIIHADAISITRL